jgi:hypothetical protein
VTVNQEIEIGEEVIQTLVNNRLDTTTQSTQTILTVLQSNYEDPWAWTNTTRLGSLIIDNDQVADSYEIKMLFGEEYFAVFYTNIHGVDVEIPIKFT